MKLKLKDVGLIAFVLFFIGMVVLIRVDEKKAKKGKWVVGRIIDKERTKYVIHFIYEFDGKDYEKSTYNEINLFDHVEPGELFMVSVDTTNPQNSLIYFDKPVLNVNKLICKSSGKVKVDRNLNSDLVEFVYAADDSLYKRKQMTTEGDRDQYEGKYFLVKYYCDDPSIGYIFLDSVSKIGTN